MSEEMMGAETTPNRPGCVSAYAILLWISSGLGVISMLCVLSGLTGLEARVGIFEIVLAGVALIFAAIYVVAGIGLWKMRKWGWALVVVMHTLTLIGALLGLLGILFLAVGSELIQLTPYLFGNLINLAVSGLILYWFIKNRELFNGTPTYKRVIGPDGEELLEPVDRKGSDATTILAVAGGLVLVLILVCVVVIAMLAVLGPQIGNVFSQITFELENPPPAIVPWLW